MDYRSLVNKLEAIQAGTYISEATAPTQFKPTHFHKGNLGNENPVMQTPDGAWWHETSQGGEQGGGYAIVPWQGNTKNRSKWNPASIDGIYINGKPVEFPEGVTWDTYKPAKMRGGDPAAAPVATPVATPAEKPADTIYGAGEKKPVKFGDADRAAEDMKKLDSLTKKLLGVPDTNGPDFQPSADGKPVAAPTNKPAIDKPAASGPASWKQIYDMNKDVIGDNPNLIKPGQQLKMPDGSTYTVKPGDNLSKIARGASGEPKKGGGAMPSAGGQPPYTPAKPELGTIKGATQAIPTGPTVPGNPSGVGKNQALSPDERKEAEAALKDPSVSLRDRQYYASRLGVKLPTQEDFNESGEDYNLTPMEAKAALIHGSEQDIEMLGGRENLEQIASSLRESVSIKNSLIESFGYLTDDVNVGQAKNVRFKEPIPNPGQGAFSNMADQLSKGPGAASASHVADLAGVSAGEKAAGTVAAKAATSGAWDMLKKRLPFIGSAYAAYDTVNRYKKGDYVGAGIAAAATAAPLIPFAGVPLSYGLDGINIARDYQRGEFNESQSELIGNLRDRLKDIENKEMANEGGLAVDAFQGVKNFFKGVKSPNVTPLPNAGAATNVKYKGPSTAFKAGQAIGRKPQVVAGTVVGAGAGAYGLSGDNEKKTPADQVAQADGSNKGNKGQGGMPSTGATSADQQAIIDQMNEIIARYNGDGADDEILSYIVPAQNAIAKVTGQGSQSEFTPAVKGQGAQPSSEEKRTPAEVNYSKDVGDFMGESDNELARWLKIARG